MAPTQSAAKVVMQHREHGGDGQRELPVICIVSAKA